MKIVVALLPFLLLLPLLPMPAHAAEEGVYTLGEIVVSGEAGAGAESVGTVHELTAVDIARKNARTVAEAISLLPGVNVRNGAEGVPRIDIRGFKTRHVLLLLDGIPFNSAFDQQFDPTLIPTENISRIKLTAGASSVLYGQGGLGGVINIITKKGERGISGQVSAETGDHEPYLTRASLSGARGKFDFFLSGSAYQSDSFPLPDDFRPTAVQNGGYRLNSDRERKSLFANLGFSPSGSLTLGLTANYFHGSFGKPPGVISDLFDPFASPPKFERIDDQEGWSMQLAADASITREFTLRSWAFYNRLDEQDNLYDNRYYNTFNDPAVLGSFQIRNSSIARGVSLQPKYDLGRAGTVTMGLSAEWDTWKDRGRIKDQGTGPFTFRPLSDHKDLYLYTGSLEYEFFPLKELGLVAGLGHHWQVRDESTVDGYSLLLGGWYDLESGTRLKASLNRNIRFPSLSQLYQKDSDNPDLNPERAGHCQLGAEQRFAGNGRLALDGFYTIVKDAIQKDKTDTGINRNFSEFRFYGFEAVAESRFVKGLLLRAGYTLLFSEDRSGSGKEQLQYTPRDKVTLETGYDFQCGFSPYLSLLYVANQYFYTKDGTPLQKMRLKDYLMVSTKLNQRLLEGRVNLYIGVDNLLDENYETSYGFPQPGRFIYGGVEFHI